MRRRRYAIIIPRMKKITRVAAPPVVVSDIPRRMLSGIGT